MSEVEFNNQLTDEVKISPEAMNQLAAIVDQEAGASGIRIYVSGGGCSGMAYGMTLVEQATEFDAVLKTEKLNLYVDSIALGYLSGVEIDYKTEGLNQSFVFKNVFAQTGGSGSCGGCGGAAPAGGGCA
ncbi:MAG: iron-sulfur cluster assembly accessory protein [endosymbiont of Galathealinum brachiosum]|uniref:Iron-sulfur cluster assembly accessory protein n=1 Tax=endosymbiont of Galathealinum brachiosum TaxID=2200906 RepID=A0A370DFV4_9GAMM|nr:MAG: iron-sulfur cluster assembly accessory protein [endosymbiont of Galathealinum brachiosum]